MIKQPNVAGQFCPENSKKLTEMIDSFFAKIEPQKPVKNLKAIVAPHAGYIYSWPVAAYSYSILKDYLNTLSVEHITFVILAPSHYEYLMEACIGLYDSFQTPLGNISVNKALGEQLLKSYPNYFSMKLWAFEQEHSLEVQLPFLQYITKNLKKKVSILPILIGTVNHTAIANALYELSKKENLFFIVSSDLSHFMQYEHAVKTDEDTLHRFLEKDIKKIGEEAEACGIHPRGTLTEIAIMADRKPKLLKYMNSWEVTWDRSRVVGYSSMIYTCTSE